MRTTFVALPRYYPVISVMVPRSYANQQQLQCFDDRDKRSINHCLPEIESICFCLKIGMAWHFHLSC